MRKDIIEILEESDLYGYSNEVIADKLLNLHIVSKRYSTKCCDNKEIVTTPTSFNDSDGHCEDAILHYCKNCDYDHEVELH